MAKLGLKTFSMAIDKGWEKLPDAAFRADTYIPKEFQKDKAKDQDQDKGKDRPRDRERRSRRRSRSRSSSAPSDRDQEEYYSSRHRSSRSQTQQQQQPQNQHFPNDSPQQQTPYPLPIPNPQEDPRAYQGYQPPYPQHPYYPEGPPAFQPQPQSYPQGDPNFPYYNTPKHQDPQAQDRGLSKDIPQDPAAAPPPPPPPNFADPWQQQQPQPKPDPPPMQNDQYYPPPAGARDPSGYHRYNPSDYQPHGYTGSGYQEDRYAPTRYNPDPYQRPASAGGHEPYDRRRSTADDGYGGYADDRRGRDVTKHSHSHREERDRSGGETGVRGMMHNHFDTTEKGLAAGGIGALAGGYIGRRIGKGPLATVAGALIGGIGANVWEGREERKAEERKHGGRRARSEGRGHDRDFRRDDRDNRGYDDDDGSRYYNESSGRGRGGYEDDGYDGDDRDYAPKRSSSRRKSSSRRYRDEDD